MTVTATTMINGLESVGSLNTRETGMLKNIDQRLIQWADWKAGSSASCAGSGGGNIIATLMESQGELIRCTNPDIGGMPDDVYDIDQAVNQLSESMQAVVELHYLNFELAPYQKALQLGLSKATYYRRVWKAHHEIQFLLKPKNRLRSRTGLADRMKGKRVEVMV